MINFLQSFKIVRNAPSYIFPICFYSSLRSAHYRGPLDLLRPFCLVILSYHFLPLNSSIAAFADIACSVPMLLMCLLSSVARIAVLRYFSGIAEGTLFPDHNRDRGFQKSDSIVAASMFRQKPFYVSLIRVEKSF